MCLTNSVSAKRFLYFSARELLCVDWRIVMHDAFGIIASIECGVIKRNSLCTATNRESVAKLRQCVPETPNERDHG